MNKATDCLEKAQKFAQENFARGLSCSVSVYEALLRSEAVSEQDAPYSTCAMCAGFGGGIGLSGLTCGALSAAVMAVGAKFGRKDPQADKDSGVRHEVDPRRFNSMVTHFTMSMQSAVCDEITKPYQSNWTDPQRKVRCAQAVAAAVEIACRHLDMSAEEVAALPWGYSVIPQKQK